MLTRNLKQGDELTQVGAVGFFTRNKTPLTAQELCNTIDKVTLAFLGEVGQMG